MSESEKKLPKLVDFDGKIMTALGLDAYFLPLQRTLDTLEGKTTVEDFEAWAAEVKRKERARGYPIIRRVQIAGVALMGLVWAMPFPVFAGYWPAIIAVGTVLATANLRKAVRMEVRFFEALRYRRRMQHEGAPPRPLEEMVIPPSASVDEARLIYALEGYEDDASERVSLSKKNSGARDTVRCSGDRIFFPRRTDRWQPWRSFDGNVYRGFSGCCNTYLFFKSTFQELCGINEIFENASEARRSTCREHCRCPGFPHGNRGRKERP